MAVPTKDQSVLLHVGVGKTGSTAIQQFLFNNSSFLASHGFQFANTHYQDDSHINNINHHILRHRWPGWLDIANFPLSPEEAWDYLAKEANSFAGTTIVSSERFPDLFGEDRGEEIIRFIRDYVSPAKLQIIGYVRRQDDLADSHFKELIKGNNLEGTQDGFVNDLPAFFDFFAMFDRASDVIGRDNVFVKLYEPALFPRRNVVQSFVEFIIGTNLEVPLSRSNPSLNALAAAVFADPRLITYRRHPDLNFVVREVLNQSRFHRFSGNFVLSRNQRREILENYSASNVKLAEKYLTPREAELLLSKPGEEDHSLHIDRPAITVDELVELIAQWIGRSLTAMAERNQAVLEREELAKQLLKFQGEDSVSAASTTSSPRTTPNSI